MHDEIKKKDICKDRILIFYPPGRIYLRGEDRCQADVESSAATSLRAPNDLGYMAAVSRNLGLEVLLRDYPAEKLKAADFFRDLHDFRPTILVMSVTTASLQDDINFFRLAKKQYPSLLTIAKGSFFFDCPPEVLDRAGGRQLDLDIAICGEAETILSRVIEAIRKNGSLENVQGLLYFDASTGRFIKTAPAPLREDLDAIPFPARDLMKNHLYVRPDTGKPMATIYTARGCPSSCIYCLSPVISGKTIRQRSPGNVLAEIKECVERYGIRDFFFMADTFTFDKDWVIRLCQGILDEGLRIRWCANSRVKPLDEERLRWMKQAGCWLISLGIESGSEESLRLTKKGAMKEDAVKAVEIIRRAGLKLYGFFMIGFPWEGPAHIRETLDFAKQLDCDFSEIHIAVPFQGTGLEKILGDYGLLLKNQYGFDYFRSPPLGTQFLKREELIAYRKQGLRELYLSPKAVLRTLKSIRTPGELVHYFRYGFRLLKNLMFR